MTERPLEATVTQRGVLFAPDGLILTVRRATDGGWELPGGRLASEEDATVGLHREILEETDLEPTIYRPVHATSWRNDADDGRFAVYYYCHVSSRAVSLSEEHDDFAWGPPREVQARLSETQTTAVDAAVTVHGRRST
jgi:8-oxo-dGTP pyrophosphatase MutT (NUDIX family)